MIEDKQLNKRAYEVWQEELTATEKADKLNKEFGLSWANRTWQQRAKNYSVGLEDGIEESSTDEELERIARARKKAMREQKLAVMMKNPIHKEARQEALEKAILDQVYSITNLPKYETRVGKHNTLGYNRRVIEVIISDLHFKGGKEEQEHVSKIFNEIRDVVSNRDWEVGDEFRLVFLGDELEGMSAHESQLAQASDIITQITELIPLLVEGCNDVFDNVECDKSLVFVPYSNHGLTYGRQKDRYQFPKSDYGLILLSALQTSINSDVVIYDVDHDKMLVETQESIYIHGHQGYMKNINQRNQVLGVDKDIDQGHLHHYEEIEERNRTVTKFPTCRRAGVDYEDLAGYKADPQITFRAREYKVGQCVTRKVIRSVIK